MNCEQSLRNHDQPLIKWWIILKNEDVDQKYWSLIVCWPQLTFFPIQLIFNHLSNWLSKFVMQDLKLDMSIFEYIWGVMKTIWGLWNPIFLEKHKTLVMDPLLRRRIDWSTLEHPWAIENPRRMSWIKWEWKFWGTIMCKCVHFSYLVLQLGFSIVHFYLSIQSY